MLFIPFRFTFESGWSVKGYRGSGAWNLLCPSLGLLEILRVIVLGGLIRFLDRWTCWTINI